MKYITFTLKYTNQYGGASYKSTDSRDTATIYISPNAFVDGPVKEFRISAEGFVNPADVLAAKQRAIEEKEAKKLARAEARAAAREERLARKLARENVYELQPTPLRDVSAWLEGYRAMWQHNLDALKRYVESHLDDEDDEPPP